MSLSLKEVQTMLQSARRRKATAEDYAARYGTDTKVAVSTYFNGSDSPLIRTRMTLGQLVNAVAEEVAELEAQVTAMGGTP